MTDPAADPVFQILLVEDAPDQSFLLSAILQKLGPFQVTLAQDGVAALELVRKRTFDLVLTDLNLPGMDGFALTRAIKASYPDLPILAATGYGDPEYAEGAYRAGVDALMTKPVDPEDLESRLRELIPHWRDAESRAPAVLAVGARPGDVEFGCGASLAGHHASGHDVLVVVLEEGHPDEAARTRARRAADALGIRLLLAEPPPGGDRGPLLARLVEELRPTWAYIPSAAHGDEHRQGVHAAAARALRSVPTVLAYATASSTLAFHPAVFREVGRWMDAKLTALACLQQTRDPDPAVAPEFALAHARYWGRLKDFAEVEPFELLGGTEGDGEAPAATVVEKAAPAAASAEEEAAPAAASEMEEVAPAAASGVEEPPRPAPPRPFVAPPMVPTRAPRDDGEGRG